ncbi:MAG: type II CAAX endopeptidase family protein [Candidatus Eisenbacteria bacterium]|nr:type II CAAX endopeptidase family protein [Candidatus Eisenbacteria bacterium]
MESGEKHESMADSVRPDEETTELLLRPLFALAIVLECFVLLQVLAVLFSFLLGVSYALVPAFVVGGILPVLVLTRWMTGSARSFLRLLPVRPLPLVFSVGASFSFIILQYNVAGLIEKFFPMPVWIQDFLIEITRVRSLSQFVIVASGVVIAAAVAEELLFRGLLQGSLEKRYGRWRGILLTSLLFAFLHDPWRFFPILFLGGLFGFLVSRGHSIYYGMIAHAITNATSVAGGNLFGIEGGKEISLPLSFVVLMAVVFLVSIAGFVRSTEREEPAGAPLPVLGESPTRVGNNSQHSDSL